MRMRHIATITILTVIFLSACAGQASTPTLTPLPANQTFDGEMAFEHARAQMELGARPTGSEAWVRCGDYIVSRLQQWGWDVEEQEFTYRGRGDDGPERQVRNIIGRMGEGPVIIIGAHYDTRLHADQDRDDPEAPVPGANDGASGVAVLLELARVLPTWELNREIWLAFFDAEDNGRIDDWEWIVGSTYMAEHLDVVPEYVIVVDMIGDADQQIYYDGNSDRRLSEAIWEVALDLGYDEAFFPETRYRMLDDHTPFTQRGITAVDIIDFDYPYWHTTEDTLDKISAESLERVGRTLQEFFVRTGVIE